MVLSLNVFSAGALAALVPALGACLFGLSLAKLWMELAVSTQERDSSAFAPLFFHSVRVVHEENLSLNTPGIGNACARAHPRRELCPTGT